jgi:hypothetical protein
MTNDDIKKLNLSKDDKSVLLYAETCVVDRDGLLEGGRMNADDIDALNAYRLEGIIKFGRIPVKLIGKYPFPGYRPTHWVTFTDRAWQIAGALRRERAESEPGPFRQKVNDALGDEAGCAS